MRKRKLFDELMQGIAEIKLWREGKIKLHGKKVKPRCRRKL
jgi:hypothetical protein